MSVWDQHADFRAEQVARLATQDELEAQGLFELMRGAYQRALDEIHLKYRFTVKKEKVKPQGGIADLIPLRYQAPTDPLPEDCLHSRNLTWHALELFDTDVDESWLRTVSQSYELWCDNKTVTSASSSSRFEVQQFTRAEIARWLRLRGIESVYAFVKTDADSTALSDIGASPIDPSTLATPDELLAAFEQWGLKKRWFNEPSKHPWLYAAREFKGKGGNKATPPLYCPYKVMIGLLRKSRTGRRRFSEQKGWEILRKNFPSSYERFKGYIPDDDQSKNDS